MLLALHQTLDFSDQKTPQDVITDRQTGKQDKQMIPGVVLFENVPGVEIV